MLYRAHHTGKNIYSYHLINALTTFPSVISYNLNMLERDRLITKEKAEARSCRGSHFKPVITKDGLKLVKEILAECFTLEECDRYDLNSNEYVSHKMFNKYCPRMVTRILFFFRKNHAKKSKIHYSDLESYFVRPISVLSNHLSSLVKRRLISRIAIKYSDLKEPRRVVSLTLEGGEAIKNILYYALGHTAVSSINDELAFSEYIEKKRIFNPSNINKEIVVSRMYDLIIAKEKYSQANEFKEECVSKWKIVWNELKFGTKYRSPYKSGPVFIYLFLRTKGILINNVKIMDLFKMSERDFRDGLKILIPLYSEYRNRDKKKCVSAYILKITENSDYYLTFISKAFQIINLFWSEIRHLKEEIIISCILLLTYIQMGLSSIDFNNCCKSIGAAPSSAYNAINRYIIKNSKYGNFHGFKESSSSVKLLLNKISLSKVEV